MIIKRKTFSEQPTPADLQAEQMKLQRQAMELQKQRERLRAEETKKRLSVIQDIQRQQAQRDEEEAKNQIKIKKIEQENNRPENVGLYKSRSKVVTPIPMRG